MKLFLSKFGMDQTELLMLSKQDYDNILMIQETPELKERVRFLKRNCHGTLCRVLLHSRRCRNRA
jgi:hypothetical protein